MEQLLWCTFGKEFLRASRGILKLANESVNLYRRALDIRLRGAPPQKESVNAAARKHAVAMATPMNGLRNQYRRAIARCAAPPATGNQVSAGESRSKDT